MVDIEMENTPLPATTIPNSSSLFPFEKYTAPLYDWETQLAQYRELLDAGNLKSHNIESDLLTAKDDFSSWKFNYLELETKYNLMESILKDEIKGLDSATIEQAVKKEKEIYAESKKVVKKLTKEIEEWVSVVPELDERFVKSKGVLNVEFENAKAFVNTNTLEDSKMKSTESQEIQTSPLRVYNPSSRYLSLVSRREQINKDLVVLENRSFGDVDEDKITVVLGEGHSIKIIFTEGTNMESVELMTSLGKIKYDDIFKVAKRKHSIDYLVRELQYRLSSRSLLLEELENLRAKGKVIDWVSEVDLNLSYELSDLGCMLGMRLDQDYPRYGSRVQVTCLEHLEHGSVLTDFVYQINQEDGISLTALLERVERECYANFPVM
eukprot:TRINITY_DN307_c0_g1_i1.p1 TRINITY_DN307_c0_g1~~TRINITY_DN307_c0_g1_i1.p1  ORF type:complete len:381 (-),score=92.26 TRINITY_DN307_c0_g1_i1:82-1224(-)